MKTLLTGGTGQIGWELRRTLAPTGRVIAPTRDQLDLSEPDELATVVRKRSPDLVVNAAAYTDVDDAESNPDQATAVNARAPGVLAEAADEIGAAMVHYSTDYVFDGGKDDPYVETDEPDPSNVYGETKLEGERAVRDAGVRHLIVRTSWVYGLRRDNFLTTMQRLFREQETVEVVDDQFGSPTWCRLVAEATALMLARWEEGPLQDEAIERFDSNGSRRQLEPDVTGGLYHLAAVGSTSWHGFASAIRDALEQRAAGKGREGVATAPGHRVGEGTSGRRQERSELAVEKIRPVSSEHYRRSYSQAASRPDDTVLSSQKMESDFGLQLPGWREALSLCMGTPVGESR